MAKILVVDDDLPFARQVASQLAGAGHHCQTVGDGERAMAILAQDQVDLLILDVMIPGISGFEICRRIHANVDLYALPILFLSAMNGEEEIAHGLAQGGDDFLTKPVQREVLINRVQDLLAMSARNRMVDETTSLPGPRHVKLEVHRAVNLRHQFTLLYAELLQLNEFGRNFGPDARARAVRHLARGLHLCSEEMEMSHFFAGHMGGGHFMVLVDTPHAEGYCRRVQKVWDRHLPTLMKSLNVLPDSANHLRLAPLFCAVANDPASKATTQELFETLTRLRQTALTSGAAGLFSDRRR